MIHIVVIISFVILSLGFCDSSTNTVQIILARFEEVINEEFNWILEYNHIIYNKGVKINGNFTTIDLQKNVGRESFVYLEHIIRNYENLPDISIFSQAALSWSGSWVKFKSHVDYFASKENPFNTTHYGFAYLDPDFRCYNVAIYLHRNSKNIFGIADELKISYNSEDVIEVYRTVLRSFLNFDCPYPRFVPAATFAVSKEAILRNTKEHYEQLLHPLTKHIDPNIGHFYERSWPFVFHSNCSDELEYHCSIYNYLTECREQPGRYL
jgi:hypothetical protein